jgi:hypothetical protein
LVAVEEAARVPLAVPEETRVLERVDEAAVVVLAITLAVGALA